MSNGVPAGWEAASFGDLCKFSGGSAFKEKYQGKGSGDYPFIKVSDMNIEGNQRFITKANHWIDQVTRLEAKVKLFPEPAVVFAKVGAALLLNRRRILTRETAIDNNMMAAIPFEDGHNFLYYALQEVDLGEIVQGGAVPSVNQAQMEDIPVLIPPLSEQQKIATILSSVDDVIEKTRAQIDKLKDLKTGMMQELLTKGIGHTEFKDSPVGPIPAEWMVVRLGGSLECIDSGWSPSCIEIPPVPGKWGVLKVSSVTRGEFLENESKTLPDELLPRNNAQVHAGDVLLTRANGVAELVGKCVIVRKEPQAKLMMSDKILRLKPSQTLHNEFLLHVFNSQIIRKQIELSWGGSSGQKNIGQSDIKSYLIPLPSVEEQRLIARSITQVERVVFDQNKKLVALMNTKKALMQDLLTGKVRVKTQKDMLKNVE